MNLAVIPARGGSKRIPKKNIKLFAGKPLIAYSIEAAIASEAFEKIIVSTDSEEIAEVAIQFGAEVPFIRPADLADDFTGTTPVTRHTIEYCRQNMFEPEFCCCIYATAPFLSPSSLLSGIEQLKQKQSMQFAFSVTSFDFPVQRALVSSEQGVAALWPEDIGKRSQDLTDAFHDAGQFYWGRTAAYLQKDKIFSQHSIPIFLPRYLVQDIDTLEDWIRAELMYKAYIQGKNGVFNG